jgi:hypothetical protein
MSILKNYLEPKGEVWRKGNLAEGLWYLTANYVPIVDRKEVIAKIKVELERGIFGDTPPSWAPEFAAGIRTGLSVEEAWHFAQGKIIEAHPELKTRAGETEVEP